MEYQGGMKSLVFAILLGLSSAVTVGCGADHHHPATPASGASAIKAPGTATIGDKTLCPVSGEDFVVTADSPKVEVDGKTYYTCCSGCAKKLAADPKKYLAKLPKST